MSELRKILDGFCKLEGVRGALIVGPQGAIRASSGDERFDGARIAELIHGCMLLGNRLGGELKLDTMNQMYLEFDGFNVTSETVGDGAFAVVANQGANLGRIRLEIRKHKKNVESVDGFPGVSETSGR